MRPSRARYFRGCIGPSFSYFDTNGWNADTNCSSGPASISLDPGPRFSFVLKRKAAPDANTKFSYERHFSAFETVRKSQGRTVCVTNHHSALPRDPFQVSVGVVGIFTSVGHSSFVIAFPLRNALERGDPIG